MSRLSSRKCSLPYVKWVVFQKLSQISSDLEKGLTNCNLVILQSYHVLKKGLTNCTSLIFHIYVNFTVSIIFWTHLTLTHSPTRKKNKKEKCFFFDSGSRFNWERVIQSGTRWPFLYLYFIFWLCLCIIIKLLENSWRQHNRLLKLMPLFEHLKVPVPSKLWNQGRLANRFSCTASY